MLQCMMHRYLIVSKQMIKHVMSRAIQHVPQAYGEEQQRRIHLGCQGLASPDRSQRLVVNTPTKRQHTFFSVANADSINDSKYYCSMTQVHTEYILMV